MVLTFFGKNYVTSNALAIAVQSALSNKKTCYLDLSKHSSYTAKFAFLKFEKKEVIENLYFDHVGVDALIRNIKAGMVKEENIRDISIEVDKNLHYIPNVIPKISALTVEINILQMIEILKKFYDILVVDMSQREVEIEEEIEEMRQYSDLLICNLEQNKLVAQNYFEHYKNNVRYCIGNYDFTAKCSVTYLKNMIKKKILYIEHNSNFLDAMQNGKILSFFYRNKGVDQASLDIYRFMKSVNNTFQELIKEDENETK